MRKSSQIKADIRSIKDAIEVTTDASEKKMLEEGLSDLKKELEKAESKPAKKNEPTKSKANSKKPKKTVKKYNENKSDALRHLINELTDVGIDLEGEDETAVASFRMELEDANGDVKKALSNISEFKSDWLKDISDKKAKQLISSSIANFEKSKSSKKTKNVKKTFSDFEEELTEAIEKEQGITRSDAQGFVEAHAAEVKDHFQRGHSAAKTLIELFPTGKNVLSSKTKKAGNFHLVKEGETEQIVSKNITLHKISDNVYDLRHKGKSTFEFEKKGNKWHVECKIKDRVKTEGFYTLNGAVMYVSKHVYSEDLKAYIQSRQKAAKRVQKFKEKHPTGAASAAQTMTKAVEKTVEKLEDKVDNDESIKKQTDAIINQVIELLISLKELGVAKADLDRIKKELN